MKKTVLLTIIPFFLFLISINATPSGDIPKTLPDGKQVWQVLSLLPVNRCGWQAMEPVTILRKGLWLISGPKH